MRYRPIPVPPGNRAVAANMTRLRIKADMTQAELGERLGWSFKAVSAAERTCDRTDGRGRVFGADLIVQLAGIFGVTPGELIASPPACSCCGGEPAPGMTCQQCGTAGRRFAASREQGAA